MPDSSAPREEALRFFGVRFGVPRDALADLSFIERREEIWACRSLPPAGIESDRPPGLRALRRQADDLKPTSTFLIALGSRIATSRVELGADDLRRVLLGQRIPSPPAQTEGHVAICFRGDVVGCGAVRGGALAALIPTGRRRELLGALDADPRA